VREAADPPESGFDVLRTRNPPGKKDGQRPLTCSSKIRLLFMPANWHSFAELSFDIVYWTIWKAGAGTIG
jgi:hypothetical protein